MLYTSFTQDTLYVVSTYMYNVDGDPCTDLMLTVSAYNGAGDGDKFMLKYYVPNGEILRLYTIHYVIL